MAEGDLMGARLDEDAVVEAEDLVDGTHGDQQTGDTLNYQRAVAGGAAEYQVVSTSPSNWS